MSVFKEDPPSKRVIFNVRLDLAERLEQAKLDARRIGRRLDADGAVDAGLEKFLKKAERKLRELEEELGEGVAEGRFALPPDEEPDTAE